MSQKKSTIIFMLLVKLNNFSKMPESVLKVCVVGGWLESEFSDSPRLELSLDQAEQYNILETNTITMSMKMQYLGSSKVLRNVSPHIFRGEGPSRTCICGPKSLKLITDVRLEIIRVSKRRSK